MSSTQEVGDIFGAGAGPANAMLRSPTVLIVAVGLWGMNIFFFRLFGINYKYVLKYDLLKEEQELLDQQDQGGIGGGGPDASNSPSTTAGNLILAKAPSSADSELTITTDNLNDDLKTHLSVVDEEHHHHHPSRNSTTASSMDAQYHALVESTTNTSGADITWYKLVIFSMILLVLLHSTTHFWMDVLGRGVIGAVFCFYITVVVYIFIPLASNQWLRKAFRITIQRTGALLHPRCWCFRSTSVMPRPVPFVDVFYADAMCSLSKVFFDWGMLLHMASHYPKPVPQAAHNIIIPSFFATIPFLIRARQCLLMLSIGKLKNDPHRYQHLANAIKYSTSIWPLLLSAYQKTMLDGAAAKELDIYLYVLQTINALYALYWDIVMDWGMMQNPQAIVAQACVGTSSLTGGGSGSAIYDPIKPSGSNLKDDAPGHRQQQQHHRHQHQHQHQLHRSSSSLGAIMPTTEPYHGHPHDNHKGLQCHHLFLRPRLRFGLTMSALIVLADAVLRFSWVLRFVSSHAFVSHDAFVLCTQFLEVFRRAIWNLLRVEWENIKQKSKQLKARDSLSDTEDDDNDLFLTITDTTLGEQELVELTLSNSSSSSTNNNNNKATTPPTTSNNTIGTGSATV